MFGSYCTQPSHRWETNVKQLDNARKVTKKCLDCGMRRTEFILKHEGDELDEERCKVSEV